MPTKILTITSNVADCGGTATDSIQIPVEIDVNGVILGVNGVSCNPKSVYIISNKAGSTYTGASVNVPTDGTYHVVYESSPDQAVWTVDLTSTNWTGVEFGNGAFVNNGDYVKITLEEVANPSNTLTDTKRLPNAKVDVKVYKTSDLSLDPVTFTFSDASPDTHPLNDTTNYSITIDIIGGAYTGTYAASLLDGGIVDMSLLPVAISALFNNTSPMSLQVVPDLFTVHGAVQVSMTVFARHNYTDGAILEQVIGNSNSFTRQTMLKMVSIGNTIVDNGNNTDFSVSFSFFEAETQNGTPSLKINTGLTVNYEILDNTGATVTSGTHLTDNTSVLQPYVNYPDGYYLCIYSATDSNGNTPIGEDWFRIKGGILAEVSDYTGASVSTYNEVTQELTQYFGSSNSLGFNPPNAGYIDWDSNGSQDVTAPTIFNSPFTIPTNLNDYAWHSATLSYWHTGNSAYIINRPNKQVGYFKFKIY